MNPKRYSQIERAMHILDKSSTVAILKDDHYLLFLFKKTERIAAALYVLTGLFPDAEPLKWSLRDSVSKLLGHVLSFNERATVQSKEILSDTLAEMTRLHSLADLAFVADMLSPMNHSVLGKELDNVLSILDGKWRTSAPASPAQFNEDFFGVPKDVFGEVAENHAVPVVAAGAESPDDAILRSLSEFERLKRNQKDIYKGHLMIKDTVLNKKDTGVARFRAVGKRPASPVLDQTKDERKERILSVLRQKTNAMIKDFSAVITDCSEKTIQRLLIEMVQGGVLKREGNRRWSKYKIAGRIPPTTAASAA